MGHTTVAKFTQHQIEGGRTVAHTRSMKQNDTINSSEDALPDLKKRRVLMFFKFELCFIV